MGSWFLRLLKQQFALQDAYARTRETTVYKQACNALRKLARAPHPSYALEQPYAACSSCLGTPADQPCQLRANTMCRSNSSTSTSTRLGHRCSPPCMCRSTCIAVAWLVKDAGRRRKSVGFQRVRRAETTDHLLYAYLSGFEAVPIQPAHTPGVTVPTGFGAVR